MTPGEKMEIITLVEQSQLSVKATLKELGINCSTFYQWYKRYLQAGYQGLSSQSCPKRWYWNQVPEKKRTQVVEIALKRADLSCRKLAWHIVDQEGWGWYYLSTVLDDYSRFVLSWQLCSSMQAVDAEASLQQALQVAGLSKGQRPRVLTDNGSAYVSKYLKQYFLSQDIQHVRSAPHHPMTQGKIERYHRSMKNLLLLEHYLFTPGTRTTHQ